MCITGSEMWLFPLPLKASQSPEVCVSSCAYTDIFDAQAGSIDLVCVLSENKVIKIKFHSSVLLDGYFQNI